MPAQQQQPPHTSSSASSTSKAKDEEDPQHHDASSSVASEVFDSSEDGYDDDSDSDSDDDDGEGYMYFDWTPFRLTLQAMVVCHLLGVLLGVALPVEVAERVASALAFLMATVPSLLASPLRRVKWSSATLALWAILRLLMPPESALATSRLHPRSVPLMHLLSHGIRALAWDVLRLLPHTLGTTSSGRLERRHRPWQGKKTAPHHWQPPGLRLGLVLAVLGATAELVSNWQQRQCRAMSATTASLCYCRGLRRFAQHPHLMGQVCVWSGVWRMHAASLVAPRDPSSSWKGRRDGTAGGAVVVIAMRRWWRAALATAAFLASVGCLVARASGRMITPEQQKHLHHHPDHLWYGYGVDPLYTTYVNSVPLLFGVVPFDPEHTVVTTLVANVGTAQQRTAPHAHRPPSVPSPRSPSHDGVRRRPPASRTTPSQPSQRSDPAPFQGGVGSTQHSAQSQHKEKVRTQDRAVGKGKMRKSKPNNPTTAKRRPRKLKHRTPIAVQRALPLPKREGGTRRSPLPETTQKTGRAAKRPPTSFEMSPSESGMRRAVTPPPKLPTPRDARRIQTPQRDATSSTPSDRDPTAAGPGAKHEREEDLDATSDIPRGRRPLDDLVRWHALLESRHELFDWEHRTEPLDAPVLRAATRAVGGREILPSRPATVLPQSSSTVQGALPNGVVQTAEPTKTIDLGGESAARPVDNRKYSRMSLQTLVDAGDFVDGETLAWGRSRDDVVDRWLDTWDGDLGAKKGPGSLSSAVPRTETTEVPPSTVEVVSTRNGQENPSKPGPGTVADDSDSYNSPMPSDVEKGATESTMNVEELNEHPNPRSLVRASSVTHTAEPSGGALPLGKCNSSETAKVDPIASELPETMERTKGHTSETMVRQSKITDTLMSELEAESFEIVNDEDVVKSIPEKPWKHVEPRSESDVFDADDVLGDDTFQWFDESDEFRDEESVVAGDNDEHMVLDEKRPEHEAIAIQSVDRVEDDYPPLTRTSSVSQGKDNDTKVESLDRSQEVQASIENHSKPSTVSAPTDRTGTNSKISSPSSAVHSRQRSKNTHWGHADGFRKKPVPRSSLAFGDNKRVFQGKQHAFGAETLTSKRNGDFSDALMGFVAKSRASVSAELRRQSVIAMRCAIKLALWIYRSIDVDKRIAELKLSLGRVERLRDLSFVDLDYEMNVESETDAVDYVFDRFEGFRVPRLLDLWNVDLEAKLLLPEEKTTEKENYEPDYKPWSYLFESLRVDRLRELWLEDYVDEEELPPPIAPIERAHGLTELWLIEDDML